MKIYKSKEWVDITFDCNYFYNQPTNSAMYKLTDLKATHGKGDWESCKNQLRETEAAEDPEKMA